MAQTILVTGGTGYIGAWVVKGLLEKGYTVRMAVRNKAKTEKYQFLVDIADKASGTLEIWEADLLKAGSYDEAAKGADGIMHLASPFMLTVKDPQKDLVDPAVKGTANVLEAASKSGTVKKIVLTSSIVAIYGDAADMVNQGISTFTEEHFNTTSSLSHQPYSYSKVMAEKKAWEMAKAQNDWQLVVMNPSFVMGPSLTKGTQSESLKVMSDILTGKFKSGAPELTFAFVDVRDVAKAHIFGMENEAEGRHILSGYVGDIMDFIEVIRAEYGTRFALPTKHAPKWLLMLLGPLFGLTRKFVKLNVGHPFQMDNTKSRERLKMDYIPLQQTARDMTEQMVEMGMIK